MKILMISALCLVPALGMASPVSEAKGELKALAQLCPRLPAAGGTCPDLKKAARKAEKLCWATHKVYSDGLAKARAKVKETERWMATKSMVNETEDFIHISFSLSNDPDYPMIDVHNGIVNDSLQESLKNIYAVQDDLKEIRERRSCDEAEIQRFYAVWSPGKQGGIDRAHEKIAVALSEYLIGAMRAFESGAYTDAIRALERETGAKVTKVK